MAHSSSRKRQSSSSSVRILLWLLLLFVALPMALKTYDRQGDLENAPPILQDLARMEADELVMELVYGGGELVAKVGTMEIKRSDGAMSALSGLGRRQAAHTASSKRSLGGLLPGPE